MAYRDAVRSVTRADRPRRRLPGWAVAEGPFGVRLFDVGIVALVIAATELNVITGSGPGAVPLDLRAYLLGALLAVPILFRHRWPFQVMLACAALIFFYYIFARRNISPAPVFFVPLYDATLAGYLVWAVSIATGFMLTGLVVVELSTGQGIATLFQEFLSQIVILVLGVTAGKLVRSREVLAAETASRLRLAEEERAADAGRVVAEERLRIARELHDAVAHSMATITVQAGSALHLLDSDAPARGLRAALTAIRETSKGALTEMRSVLGQLRRSEPGGHHAPGDAAQTGLARLEALRAAVTAAGAPVTVTVEGDQRPLSAEADHSAYRILQESLTNVLRHAGPGTAAHVCLRYQPDGLTLTVTDDGAANGVSAVLPQRDPGRHRGVHRQRRIAGPAAASCTWPRGSGRARGPTGPRVADRTREGSRRAGRLRTVQPRDRPRARGQPAHREDPRQPGDDQAERPRPGAAGDAGLRARPDRVLGALSLAALAALAATGRVLGGGACWAGKRVREGCWAGVRTTGGVGAGSRGGGKCLRAYDALRGVGGESGER
jgi:signal transduction histidine kinase